MSLVEILTLVLLAGILVLLALIFNSIAAARRALEESDRGRAAGAGRASAAPESAAGATGGYLGGAATGGGEGYATGGYGGAGAGAGTGGYGAANQGYETQPSGGYDAATGTPARTTEQPSYAGTEQTSDYASWSESTSAGGQTSGAAAVEEFPEETPFERDGRWWFKRGDELLVYDEQAGQWITPPPGTTPGGGGAGQPSSGGAGYRYDTGGGATEAAAAGVSTGEPGGWRCPSCGAINGASATTCRMCFSARP